MLEIENLTKTFGTQTVISDISMTLVSGKIYGLVHTDSDSGSMPQCSGLLRDIIKGSWHGRQVGGKKRTYCRNQSYGLAY